MNSKFRTRWHKHFPFEYNLHWVKSASLCVMALKKVIESYQSCFWPFKPFLFIVCEEREATLVSDCSCWLDSRKRSVYKKQKWGLKSHGWLLEPATAFSLMRKSRRSPHLYFLSFLDMGASVKMCSSLQAEKRQHFWVFLTTAYQGEKNSFDLKILQKLTCKAVSLKVHHNFSIILKLLWIKFNWSKKWKLHIHMATFASSKKPKTHSERIWHGTNWHGANREVYLCKLLFHKFVKVKLEGEYEIENDEFFYLLFAQQPQDNWFGSRRFHARQWTFLNMEYTQFTMVKAERPLKEQELIFTRWSNKGQSSLL